MAIALYLKVDGSTGESKNTGTRRTRSRSNRFPLGASTSLRRSDMAAAAAPARSSFQDLTVIAHAGQGLSRDDASSARRASTSTRSRLCGGQGGWHCDRVLKITLTDVLVTHANVRGADGAEVTWSTTRFRRPRSSPSTSCRRTRAARVRRRLRHQGEQASQIGLGCAGVGRHPRPRIACRSHEGRAACSGCRLVALGSRRSVRGRASARVVRTRYGPRMCGRASVAGSGFGR